MVKEAVRKSQRPGSAGNPFITKSLPCKAAFNQSLILTDLSWRWSGKRIARGRSKAKTPVKAKKEKAGEWLAGEFPE
jgi:hypothetical protein